MNICIIRRLAICTLTLLPFVAGCTSFSATHIHRDENNLSWEKRRALHGIPVTLKVPTHMRVDILDKHVLIASDIGVVKRSSPRVPLRKIETEFIETEKIFLVDIKRPAAGVLNTTVDLDPDSQYFTQIKEELTDETITQVGNLIAAIAPGGLFGAPTSDDANKTSELGENVKVVTNIVASQVFEVEDPNFEISLMAFLDRHVNCCHSCSTIQHDQKAPVSLDATPNIDRYGGLPIGTQLGDYTATQPEELTISAGQGELPISTTHAPTGVDYYRDN